MSNKTIGNVAAAVGTATWAIDANTLRSLDQQEIASKGDEVKVASIVFRTTPGKQGSTSVRAQGPIGEIANVHEGETHPIPDNTGRVTFPNVTRRGLADVLAGNNPELLGTLTAVLESDLSSDDRIRQLFVEAADEAEPIVADAIESLSLADLANPDVLADKLAELVAQVREAVALTAGQKIGLFLSSFGDPDDQIAEKLNLFVAVDDSLAPTVDAALAGAVPASQGVAGALRPRTYNQTFTGKGASYRITFQVST